MSQFKTRKIVTISSILLTGGVCLFLFNNCGGEISSKSDGQTQATLSNIEITLDFTRIIQPGLHPFKVKTHLNNNGLPLSGKSLALSIPKGAVSAITDNHDGTYEFTVTPSSTGVYPVSVSYGGVTIERSAIVANRLGAGVGQPLAVPGKFVNTEGYEDGITITPDGNYLFIQYGPLYFSGVSQVSSICASPSYTMYDILGCTGKTDSNWVFNTIGPYNDALRPNFPIGGMNNGRLTPINLSIPGVANGIARFPTVFYGFKRQTDGTFAEPFKLAFNDARGTSAPFGLSFQMTSPTTANYVVAWDNYLNDLGGDQKPNIYSGTITMGQDNNMGDVTYSGEGFASITPNIQPVNFTSHAGVQGNPHLFYDTTGVVKSIWTDDEQTTHDLSVYVLTSGTFPNGTWNLVTLPNKINTASSESQPFFTGKRLYLNRETKIVYHEYLGSGGNDYGSNAAWGDEVVVIEGGDNAIGKIYGFGEPTIATRDGKTYLYFVFVKGRSLGVGAGRMDYDLDAGFVEVP